MWSVYTQIINSGLCIGLLGAGDQTPAAQKEAAARRPLVDHAAEWEIRRAWPHLGHTWVFSADDCSYVSNHMSYFWAT